MTHPTRIERERILLRKIETRDLKITKLKNHIRKTLYVAYFTGVVVGFLCGFFLY